MDRQKELYKAQHKNDPSDPSDMSAFNAGIKGLMGGALFGIFYKSVRPWDWTFLTDMADRYFEIYIVACAVAGYIIGWMVGKFFYTKN
jgi:membrane associated rhomboid family serine protease